MLLVGPGLNSVAARNANVMMVNRNIKDTTAKSLCCLFTSLLFLVFVTACSNNASHKANVADNKVFVPAKITSISQLPAHKQPREVFLENAPRPVSIIVSKGSLQTANSRGLVKQATAPVVANAQGRGFFATFNTDNGLALDQVYCSYKDKRGNLWFGTNGGGISKYDGKTFANFTTAHGLANNSIWCITEDHNGNIWFGTDGSGASKYDGRQFTTYTTLQGLAGNIVFSIAVDKHNNLWFGTGEQGVSKFDGKKFINYTTKNGLANNAVKSIIEDKNGNIWFGTLGGGVSVFNGKTFSNFNAGNGLSNNNVWSLGKDTSGNIWLGTDKGTSKFDGATFIQYGGFTGLSDNVILSITNDRQGNIWFGSLNGGVFKYDGSNFTNYTTAQGLSNNSVRSIVEDAKGNLWFCTYGGGLCKYAGNSFTNFTTAQGLSNTVVFSIAEDKIGNLWLGTTGGGVSRYDGQTFYNYSKIQGLSDNVVYAIANDKTGNLWIGTGGSGVSKFDGRSFTHYTTLQGLANNNIFSILEDKKGNLWFGTSGGGVSKFNGKSFTNFTMDQGLANNVVFSIKEDKNGNLWFGTLGGGVSKFDGEYFTNYTTSQGLASNVVWAITQDINDNLWFGTEQGLSVMLKAPNNPYNGNSADRHNLVAHFKNFTAKDGLPNNFITQVITGNNGKLYVGTNLGICELIPGDTLNKNEKKWVVGKVFNSQTGYPVKDVNAGLSAMFKDRNGIIWIGTGSDKTGLVRFDPNAAINNNLSPIAVDLKNVTINNENISWSDLDKKEISEKIDSNTVSTIIVDEQITYGRQLSYEERDSLRSKFKKISFEGITKWNFIPKKLVLPYYFNNIDFDFNAIETGQNFMVKYQYMLKGYDKEWSPPVYKNLVNFGNIYEGKYTFLVKAQSPEGVWGKPLAFAFEVLPPWWRTWWMYCIYIILMIAVIYLLFRWNNRQIIAKKNMLENKVKMATIQLREENTIVNDQKKRIEDTLKELEATQAQLIQSEKMAGLGELAAGIAHEIQNPLNFVNNFSEVNIELIDELKTELATGNPQSAIEIINYIKDNEQKINHHGKRADAIVKGLLQHSRTSKGKKEPTDINALADEYLRIIYQGLKAKDQTFNATINTYFDRSIDKIYIIPQDIGRVLLNLYNNAFYAVTEKEQQFANNVSAGGQGYQPTIKVSTRKQGHQVDICIEDNGNGIKSNVVDKIFQPFFTTKPTGQGTGLGLSLSYDIIKAHGGDMTVETRDGEGTMFIIKLPTIF